MSNFDILRGLRDGIARAACDGQTRARPNPA
jgi:hypothetical protein